MRQRKGLSQERLAERARTSPNYVSRIERGAGNPTFRMLIKLSNALFVDPLELFDFNHDSPKALKVMLRKLTVQIEDEDKLKAAVSLLRVISTLIPGKVRRKK